MELKFIRLLGVLTLVSLGALQLRAEARCVMNVANFRRSDSDKTECGLGHESVKLPWTGWVWLFLQRIDKGT